ncbi:uncharacterized protein LOC124842841 [Vigna umbellata]|uniref:uncharacterized protein LOC124842841 n=1 Tax=Vigna umbellata TaxID=87088 RepID=UPI001F5F5CD3|nr:uncharacterized protein LOC124842841 [Vigna umbellata]
MDVRSQNLSFTANPSANAFKNLGSSMQVEVTEADCSTNDILQFDSPSSSISKGMKRKWGLIDGYIGQSTCSSMFLGLGLSTSSSDSKESSATSCTAISSVKEIDEQSSMPMDIELDFTLNLDCEKVESPKKLVSSNLKIVELQPKLDLELSLSTQPSKSDITSVCVSPSQSPPLQLNLEIPLVLSTTPPNVDEGSTSCRLKLGLVSLDPGASVMLNRTEKKVMDPSPNKLKKNLTCTSRLTQLKQPLHCNSNSTTCQVEGYGKGYQGASGLCISHGGGRRFNKAGSKKGAEGWTLHCKSCGGGRRCEYFGCTNSTVGHTNFCIAHGGSQRCSHHEGCIQAVRGKSGLCIWHGRGKRHQTEKCTKNAEGLAGLSISYGGGHQCQASGCTKGAQGNTMFCRAHGVEKRCTAPGCTKDAKGTTPLCKGHGGGKCCAYQGGGICTKSVNGGANFCVAHGGGMRCAVPDCLKRARGRVDLCVRHEGGKRCKFEGCGKGAQGATNFCETRGGRKRCSWGHPESEYINQQADPSYSLARGKTAPSALHSGLVLDKRVHGGVSSGPVIQDTRDKLGELKQIVINQDMDVDMIKMGNPQKDGVTTCSDAKLNEVASTHLPPGEEDHTSMLVAVPEGRVHGGSLMAMLKGNSSLGKGLLSDPSEINKSLHGVPE